jgi:hypothetical protein
MNSNCALSCVVKNPRCFLISGITELVKYSEENARRNINITVLAIK